MKIKCDIEVSGLKYRFQVAGCLVMMRKIWNGINLFTTLPATSRKTHRASNCNLQYYGRRFFHSCNKILGFSEMSFYLFLLPSTFSFLFFSFFFACLLRKERCAMHSIEAPLLEGNWNKLVKFLEQKSTW